MTDGQSASSARSFDLVAVLWKRWKTIFLITLFGGAIGAVASYLITPRFKSEVILFPATTNTASRALLNEGTSSGADMMMLGEEEDAQHLLQILYSDKIRERTADRFDLLAAYGIEANSEHKRAELYEAFKDNVSFEYTKFGTVRVEVMDVQPQRAADMANFIADQVDSVWSEMAHERAIKAYELVKRQVDDEARVMMAIEDSLDGIRAKGVQDYGAQADRYNQALSKALLTGNERAVKEIDGRLALLSQYGGKFQRYTEMLSVENWRSGMWRTRLAQIGSDLMSEVPHKFLMERAQPADKKSYPVRWLIVVVSALSGLFLALVLIAIKQQLQNIHEAHA